MHSQSTNNPQTIQLKNTAQVEASVDRLLDSASTDTAASFLRRFCGDDLIVLMALGENPPPVVTTFSDAVSEADIDDWIRQQQARRRNVYFTPAVVARPMQKKPSKVDVVRSGWVWADIDPRAGETPTQCKARVGGLAEPLRPTILIDSGGGVQAFWRLVQPVAPDAVERLNTMISQRVGGDHVQNVDRMMRVPGTINYPNARKREKHRVECPATILHFDDALNYGAEEIAAAFAPRPATDGAAAAADVHELPSAAPALAADRPWSDDPALPPWLNLELKNDEKLRMRWRGHAGAAVGLAALGDVSGSGFDHSVIALLKHRGKKLNEVCEAITLLPPGKARRENMRGESLRKYVSKSYDKIVITDEQYLVLNRKDPRGTAQLLLAMKFTINGTVTLIRWRQDFYRWDGAAHVAIEDELVRRIIYEFLARSQTWRPKSGDVSQVFDALGALVLEVRDSEPPMWIGALHERPAIDALDLVAVANGILDVRTRTLHAPDPRWFVINALPVNYDPAAAAPATWLAMLGDQFGDDPESMDLIGEIFGLCLTTDMSFHKIFLIIGPPRSGKGTITTVLKALIGARNCCAPSLGGLGNEFGLAPFINKTVAIVPDARLRGKGFNGELIVERLNAISGGDATDVNVKYKNQITVQLKTRIIIQTNELPNLEDASEALAKRFIVLETTQSFLGREDHNLANKCAMELPGILNWALDGLDRLRARGRFEQPDSARQIVDQFAILSNPVRVFVDEECVFALGANTPKAVLYTTWCEWCETRGQPSGTLEGLATRLYANFPRKISESRPTIAGRRQTCFSGISLREREIDFAF